MANNTIKILVIDDLQDNLITLNALIKDAFPEVVTLNALNGEAGLDLAAKEDPDVILLDIIMPEMDGYEVCQKLKADKKLHDIPVVFVTALKDNKESLIRALECGGEAFLTKPIDEIELTAQIRAMIKIRKANIQKRDEKQQLTELVAQKTRELNETYISTLNLLDNLKKEVHERRQAENVLKASEEKFRSYVDFAPHGVFVTDEKGNYVELNAAACRITGYNKAELLLMNRIDLIAPESLEVAANHFKSVVKAGFASGEMTFIKKDGSINFWTIDAVRLSDNRFLSFVVDITKRKIAEKQKQMLTDQLIQAQRMEAVGTLAGGIAHDFNNILAIIFGNAELALHDMSPENPIRHNLEEVLEASIRAKNLVRQILDFSRKDKTKLMPIHPQSLIKETLKLLSSTTPTTISINQDISEDCGAIMTDVTKFHQIIMNLFGNAIHAMNEKGEVTVSLKEVNLDSNDFSNFSIIAPHSLEIPGAFARLAVADTGAGINQEIIEQIFDPFFTTKQIGEGSGMGLSVVHGIVESQGGFITVESKEGQGSTFSVFIPITTKKEILKVEKNSLFQTGTERILLVDDEESIIDVAQQMLEGLGYKVTIESSSDKALEIFKSNPDHFDLLITDQSMPKMSGAELIDEILKMRPEMPFVLCSGYSSKVSEENYKDKISNMYLSKPYSKKLLSDAVRKVLDGNA